MKSVTLVLSMASSAIAAPTADGSSWSGWGNVKHFFAFGDSYTQTGFDVNGTQPTASNPLGNPPFPGNTWSNGPNWVGFLATKYNASNLLVYNFAVGGATVDSALVTPVDIPVIVTIKDQVQSRFLPAYGSHPASTPWTSASSLFAFFIGINDIDFSWQRGNATLYDSIFASYQKQLEDVYATGARNFLFQTIPAVNLSPLSQAQNRTQEERKKESDAIVGWNKRLTDMVAVFQDSHKGTTAFLHDTYGLYNKVMEDPKSYEQTAVYKDVTTSCAAYANLTNDSFAKDPSCKYAVNEYLWLDGLHTTFPIHDAAAASIAKLLSGETVAKTVAETVEDDDEETVGETNEAGDEETVAQTDEDGDEAQDDCDN